MDVLTLSLGGVDGWTEGSASVVASRIAAQGRVVTIAAGNGTKTFPSQSLSSIEPGAHFSVHSPTSKPFLSMLRDIFPFTQLPRTPQTDDACNPLPDKIPDLSNYVVIVHRGTCAFVRKPYWVLTGVFTDVNYSIRLKSWAISVQRVASSSSYTRESRLSGEREL